MCDPDVEVVVVARQVALVVVRMVLGKVIVELLLLLEGEMVVINVGGDDNVDNVVQLHFRTLYSEES